MITALYLALFGIFMLCAFWLGYRAGMKEQHIIEESIPDIKLRNDDMEYLDPNYEGWNAETNQK